MSISDSKIDLLYKKFVGVPLSNPGLATVSEEPGSSKSKIIPSLQIFSQSIPSIIPTDLETVTFTAANNGGLKQRSAGNIHIAKYTKLGLSTVKKGTSYRYSNPTDVIVPNLTTPAIPDNYDPTYNNGGYAISIYDNNGNSISSTDYPWVFDTDSGYLIFIDPTKPLSDSLAPPKITFWRYEGTFGLGSSGGISNFGNLTVSHLSPFDYTIDNNLFVLETAVASGVNGNLNSTQVVYSTVDSSFSGKLTVGGDFIQSNINSVLSTPSIYSASTTPVLTTISANTDATLLTNTQIIASNIASNIYTLPSVNVLLGNIYLPRQSNITINANIPVGFDISMLVQNANIAYGNNTYSNVSNTFNANLSVVGANVTIANFKLLHSIDSIKANCNYTFNNLTIPMGLNIAGTLNYKTPSDPTNANTTYINYFGSYALPIPAAAAQQIVANVTVPPYYMGNAISVYTPIAANVYTSLTTAVSGNLTAGSFANVSYNVTGIYATIYQGTNTNGWGNVTLSTSSIYGNFSFKNNGAGNMILGNILQGNVYLATGNLTFVPDICSATVIYVVKYYALGTATTAIGANVKPGLTFNTPTITGNVGSIIYSNFVVNTNGQFSSNTIYTGGTAASVTYASTINNPINVNVTNTSGVQANYINKVTNILTGNYNSIQVNIPQLSVVNADNYSIVYDTLNAGTDYSNIVVNSFSYAANTTLNNSYNANIFLGNIIITNENFTSNNYSSNIAIIGNVTINNFTTTSNINTLGYNGNINTLTLYSNPSFSTNNNTNANIKLSAYNSTTTLTAPNYSSITGNLQLTKSTLYINSNLVNINVYDTANNYVTSIPSANFTFTGNNITNSTFYGIKYGNLLVNDNRYFQYVMGMINISNYSLPAPLVDMSYSLQAVIDSNITIPHTANIISSNFYSNIANVTTIGYLTYLENSALNTNYTNYSFTKSDPYTTGYLDVNTLRVNKDLTVAGRLNVQNYTYKNIINTTVSNYQLIVSEDLSLNGNLNVSGNIVQKGGYVMRSKNISTDTTLGSNDYGIIVYPDSTTLTLTLPPASTVGKITVIGTDSDTTIAAAGTDQIRLLGSTYGVTFPIYEYSSIDLIGSSKYVLVSDGNNKWNVISMMCYHFIETVNATTRIHGYPQVAFIDNSVTSIYLPDKPYTGQIITIRKTGNSTFSTVVKVTDKNNFSGSIINTTTSGDFTMGTGVYAATFGLRSANNYVQSWYVLSTY